MRAGIVLLVIGYAFSQFFRAFLAVLSPLLERDIGAMPDDLAFASGMWFVVFALMQVAVGESLDRIGPRRTAAVLFALGAGGGSVVFALAQSPGHVTLAMMLIGAGCSPILMAAYFIFAREFPARVFATLAGAMVGFGNLGNIAGTAPLAWAAGTFGWRETLWGLAVLSVIVAGLLWAIVKDPARIAHSARGNVLDVLKIRAIWPILALSVVAYAPAAAVRGLWAGPYVRDVFGADAATIGTVTLVMGIAMIVGSIAYGPLDRVLGTRKWLIFGGNAAMAVLFFLLVLFPAAGIVTATLLLSGIGLLGATFAVMVAHARAFFPPHLTGRGVTLVNMFSIGGAGLLQIVTGPIWRQARAASDSAVFPYQVLFGFIGALLVAGLTAYLFSRDRTD